MTIILQKDAIVNVLYFLCVTNNKIKRKTVEPHEKYKREMRMKIFAVRRLFKNGLYLENVVKEGGIIPKLQIMM